MARDAYAFAKREETFISGLKRERVAGAILLDSTAGYLPHSLISSFLSHAVSVPFALRYTEKQSKTCHLLRSMLPKVESLRPTCTVMGLFEAWHAEIAEVRLAPGDTLVLYTDGITQKAMSADGEEFGPSHLPETVENYSHLRVEPLLQALIGAVQQFSSGKEQQGDITLVIARSLE